MEQSASEREPVIAGSRRPDWTDAVFLLLLVVGAFFAWQKAGIYMDGYDKAILVGTVPAMAWLAWLWRPLRRLFVVVTAASLLAIFLYQGSLDRVDEAFLLTSLLSSQSATLWMCAWFFLATCCYWVGLTTRSAPCAWLAAARCWGAVLAGLGGLIVRSHATYLLSPDVGY